MDVSSGLYNLLYETPYSSGQLFEVCSKSPININIVYTVLFAKIISDASDALFKLIATMQSAYPIKNVPISLIRWCLIGQIRHVYLHQPSMSVAAVNCLERMNIRDIVDLSGSMMPWMVLQSQLVEHSLGDIATLMDSIIGNVGSRKSIDAMVQGLIQIASVGDVEKKLTRIMIGSETCSDIRVLDLHLIKTNAELISSRSCLNLSLAEHVQILCNPGANGRVVERAAFVIPIWRDAMAAYPPSMIVKSLCRTTVEAIISRRHLMGEYDDNDVVLNRVLSMVSQPKSAQNVAAMDEVDLTQPRLLDYSMSRYRSVLPTTVIATVDPIWIEIDPIGNTRMQALERGPTRDEMTNVVSPPGSGRMNITVQGVVWSPKPRTELTAEAEDDDDSVAGRLYHLKKIMKAKSAKQSVPVLFIPYKWMAKDRYIIISHS
uniref:Uncharacterized protein n=1 Tax=Spongospora subterranea TaxID=70186 RepID=A0A0H5RCC2_9EUKA|eukprot:CRZ11396.1 hypothetical protein [Spongospora subterranea]